jgi:peptidoglycan lytic transglycosylase G
MRWIIAVGIAALVLALVTAAVLPSRAEKKFGPPAEYLNPLQRLDYSARLLWYDGLLTRPADSNGVEREFVIQQGDAVGLIAYNLEAQGLIKSAEAFRDYLVYAGLDTAIQAGTFKLSPRLPATVIASQLLDITPGDVTFVVLPGWRLEEIAAALPTSGLNIEPADLVQAAQHPRYHPAYLPEGASAEGFLLPDAYVFARATSAETMVTKMQRNFNSQLNPELKRGFDEQGLHVFEAVTLASMVQREAVQEEEMPTIASVFLNRLNLDMKLDSDPTVQYALGLTVDGWWKNPLDGLDLQTDSPYNTYLYRGLPPGPIDNPSLAALRAVAFPADTPYYYFRAACDSSGRHVFAQTYEEHLANACP